MLYSNFPYEVLGIINSFNNMKYKKDNKDMQISTMIFTQKTPTLTMEIKSYEV